MTMHRPPSDVAVARPLAPLAAPVAPLGGYPGRRSGPVLALVAAARERRAIPERDAVIVRWVERNGKDYPIFRRGVYAAACLMGGAVILYAVKADGELGLWKATAAGQPEDELAAELWAWLDANDRVVTLG